ncbi:MAG: hypothetical protein JPMHGGIA_00565 [Saprospiraceae bacterium]|jgi:hypothetical protein|nr:hypothetical protein [Saprospiraceae bacterium]
MYIIDYKVYIHLAPFGNFEIGIIFVSEKAKKICDAVTVLYFPCFEMVGALPECGMHDGLATRLRTGALHRAV